MTAFPDKVTLGRSGLVVGPLGVAGGYGVPARAIHRAVEQGCTYLYHGSRRARGMRDAIRELVGAGRRREIAIVLQSYSRSAALLEWSLARGLRSHVTVSLSQMDDDDEKLRWQMLRFECRCWWQRC